MDVPAPACPIPLALPPCRKPQQPKRVLKEGECGDTNEQCREWAFFGECEKNPGFMHASCKDSCGLCPGSKKVPVQITA